MMTTGDEQLGSRAETTFLASVTGHDFVASARYGRLGNVVIKVRGWKCRDVPCLMSEFGAAFQFFDGFGENWHALQECLSYLDEWLPGEGYVVVVERAEELLRDAPDELRWFVAVMNDVARWWSAPITGNGRFDRPARPFHVVLELAGGVGASRFESVGARTSPWSDSGAVGE